MAMNLWEDPVAHEVRKLRAEIAELREFIEDTICQCYDDYGNRRHKTCDRCRLLGREEDETRPT